MEFQSILYADTTPQLQQTAPVFFKDLQLEYLLDIIKKEAKGYSLAPHFYTLPETREVILYRQQICRDLENRSLAGYINDFCIEMQKSRHSYDLSLQCEEEIQSASYYLEAAALYWQAVLDLEQNISSSEIHSEGFLSFCRFLKDEIHKKKEAGFEKSLIRAKDFFAQMQFRLILDQDRISIVEESEETENYLVELADVVSPDSSQEVPAITEIFPNLLEPSCLETALVHLLKRSRPAIFQTIRDFYHDFPDFYSRQLLQFEEEIPVYLSFLKFRENTEKLGYPLNRPEVLHKKEFHGTGLYDLALVWKNANRDYHVVANDFTYPSHSAFFVVSGPNQGGKTTFARSVGQAVYFSLMGLYVNAKSLYLPFFQGMATHFEVEERLQSNSGKLKEEINRLVPMMKQENTQQFVILNELFTTATTHDALIMGREAMNHFLKKDCYGIYVTHIQELAEETDQIISLVAQIAEEEGSRRTYRMLPMKAQGYGYSDSLVEEFALRYEDIVRRLSL